MNSFTIQTFVWMSWMSCLLISQGSAHFVNLAKRTDNTAETFLAQNHAWADAQDPDVLKAQTEGQSPPIMYIGCADSRVAPERIMATDSGKIFVHRNVGNIIYVDDDDALSVVEYAVKALKVKHIVVAGHYKCGGVHAVLKGENGFDNLDRWLVQIGKVKAAVQAELDELDEEEQWNRLVEYNAIESAKIVNATNHVRNARDAGQELHIRAWVYDIGSGYLNELEVFSTNDNTGEPVDDVESSDDEDSEGEHDD